MLIDRIAEIRESLRSHVSPGNRLASKFIFGALDDDIDPRTLVSKRNRLIHADLGNADLSKVKSELPRNS